MAFGGGKPRTRIGKRIKDIQSKEDQLFSMMRRTNTPNQVQVPFFSGVGAVNNQGESSSGFLPTAGGTMIGPIAFYPVAIAISSGSIDIGKTTDNFTSRIILTPQSGTTDDLDTIVGAEHAGQLLFVQGVLGDTITIKHGTGNIRGFNEVDFILTDNDIIILMFDSIANEWAQITVGIGEASNLAEPSQGGNGIDIWKMPIGSGIPIAGRTVINNFFIQRDTTGAANSFIVGVGYIK